MKRIILSCLLCVSLPAIAGVVRNRPARTIEEVSDGIVVTYSFNSPEIVESEYYRNTKYIRYDGFGLNDIDGEPCIPFRNDTYLVPNDCAVTVSVLDSAYRDTTFVMSPSMPVIPDDGSRISLHAITPYSGFFPKSTIQSSGVYLHREDALVSVSISPVKYNYQTNTVRRYSLIKYKLTYLGTSRIYKGKDRSFARGICQNTLHSRNNADSTIRDDRHYLIITTTEYRDSLEDFVKWKRLKGYNVHIESCLKGDWNVQSVTASVQSHLTEDSIKYLLVVGDIDDVPAQTFVSDGTTGVTDHQYGIPDANNTPQIKRGRIPVNNTTELTAILNKIINYERQPVNDESFYNTALHLAQFQDRDYDVSQPGEKDGYEDRYFTQCAEELRNYMTTNYGKDIIRGYSCIHDSDTMPSNWNISQYSYGDPIPNELKYPTFNWNYYYYNIKDAIEAGTFYVFYRGHGNELSWHRPGFPGYNSLPLENGDKLPFIFSIACFTGSYHYSHDCLAEKLLKNQNQCGGCVGIIAATHKSFSGNNDVFAFGMFDAIWPGFRPAIRQHIYHPYTTYSSPTYEVGNIMDLGLIRMKETYGNDLRTWQRYHCFGDPSMMLYTERPQPLTAPIIQIIGDTLYVSVIEEGCRINIVNNTTNEVRSYLGNHVAQYIGDDDISVCVDKHNYVPYVWQKDIYIQNENIIATNREYHARNVKVGKHVTDLKPQGIVTVTNSNVTIKANNVLLDKGTSINLGSSLKVKISQ